MRLILIQLIFFSCIASAQEERKESGNNELAVTAGQFLPYGIFGVRNTYPGFELRYAHDFQILRPDFALGLFNAHNVNFYRANIAFSDVVPFYDFSLVWYVGYTANYYKPKPTNLRTFDFRYVGGFHLGVAPRYMISPNLALRPEFQMNFSPGNSLYVGLGFSYLF